MLSVISIILIRPIVILITSIITSKVIETYFKPRMNFRHRVDGALALTWSDKRTTTVKDSVEKIIRRTPLQITIPKLKKPFAII